MWQILNRISKLVQANSIRSSDPYKVLNQDDEELKRIIDELNKTESKSKNQSAKKDADNTTIEIRNAFTTLGISPNSDANTIKTAYRTKMKEYHPDRFVNLDRELQEKTRIKAQEINVAYGILEKAGYVK